MSLVLSLTKDTSLYGGQNHLAEGVSLLEGDYCIYMIRGRKILRLKVKDHLLRACSLTDDVTGCHMTVTSVSGHHQSVNNTTRRRSKRLKMFQSLTSRGKNFLPVKDDSGVHSTNLHHIYTYDPV